MKCEIQTYTGKLINPMDPDPSLFDIEDIAHALSHQCRFSGHTRKFYSVAQHSVIAASLAVGAEQQFTMLMHDAAEAYLVDVPKPIKHHLAGYDLAEATISSRLAEHFGFRWPMTPEDKEIDHRLLFTEQRDLMNHAEWSFKGEPFEHRISPWASDLAKSTFLWTFKYLRDGGTIRNSGPLAVLDPASTGGGA